MIRLYSVTLWVMGICMKRIQMGTDSFDGIEVLSGISGFGRRD